MFDDLRGKRILITGASSGIGRAIAVFLAKEGANVALVARDRERLQETLAMLAPGGHALFPCDLSDMEAIGPLVKSIVATFGKLHGFVHSAGVGNARPLKTSSFSFMHDVMLINFYAYVELIRHIASKRHMEMPLRIVGLSSVSSDHYVAGTAAYSASKAAMDAVTRCLSLELLSKGVSLNTIQPAWVNTDMTSSAKEWISEEWESHLLNAQPLGLICAQDIAAMAAYLLSDNAKMITGAHFPISAGYFG